MYWMWTLYSYMPKDAVVLENYNMNDVIDYNKDEFSIDPGRFTQTGSNSQNVSYTVVSENLEELKALTFQTLESMGEKLLEETSGENFRYRNYAKMWINMSKEYKENPRNDKLFFNAPAIIVVSAESEVDAALASSNMELMINALGLGTFFSGFFVRSTQVNQDIMKLLEIHENKKIITCMVVGYPNVKYLRTVARKDADIIWK